MISLSEQTSEGAFSMIHRVLQVTLTIAVLSVGLTACTPALPQTRKDLDMRKLTTSVHELHLELVEMRKINAELLDSKHRLQGELDAINTRLGTIEKKVSRKVYTRPRPKPTPKKGEVNTPPEPAKLPPAEPEKPKYPEYSP